MRVAMLLPVIACAVSLSRASEAVVGEARPPLLPEFAVAFLGLAVANSLGWVPAAAVAFGGECSRWLLIAAVASIGAKTRLRELAGVGWKPVALMVGETVFLAVLVLALQRWAL